MTTRSSHTVLETSGVRSVVLIGLVCLFVVGRSVDSAAADPRSSDRGAFASSLDPLGPALPSRPRDSAGVSSVRVQPSSLAGISSSVVPAVTGDLYWSRPVLDMRVVGQSLGQNSSLRLAKPPVGVSVGSTAAKPPLVGIE